MLSFFRWDLRLIESVSELSDMGFTAHQHSKAISRRKRYKNTSNMYKVINA